MECEFQSGDFSGGACAQIENSAGCLLVLLKILPTPPHPRLQEILQIWSQVSSERFCRGLP